MMDDFYSINGTLIKYAGNDAHVVIPPCFSMIGKAAFASNKNLLSVAIPDSVTEIGAMAFEECTGLTEITIPHSVKCIGWAAFHICTGLTAAVISDGVTEIGDFAFAACGNLPSIHIPDSVTRIGDRAFLNCDSLTSVTIPGSVREIEHAAFAGCKSMTSINIKKGVKVIGDSAFAHLTALTSLTIPDGVTTLGRDVFEGCGNQLKTVFIPNSVTKIGGSIFSSAPAATVICRENSYAHQYCAENHYSFIFDYQYEAFHGVIPQDYEMLASPFSADEEEPYVFISYSHKDRDRIFGVMKTLYESGWHIWYDEGLTIGESYDETLEAHIRNCSAFLLFVTENSLKSNYIRKNEIPWANAFDKPIIKCITDDGLDYEIKEGSVAACVSPREIGPALEKISGLKKGERRKAKGISVVVDFAHRGTANDGFAYCLYAAENASTAKAILLEAKEKGCSLYDAIENGADERKLKSASCLIVFLDTSYLSDKELTGVLTKAQKAGKDIALCRLERVSAEELPSGSDELIKMHALNFSHGIKRETVTKLIRYLQERGCGSTAVIPGFKHEVNDEGIVITGYTDTAPQPKLKSEYDGVPVVEIGESAFENNFHLQAFEIPQGVKKIGKNAFRKCSKLTSITIPDSVTQIGKCAFGSCKSLKEVVIPDSVTQIGEHAFSRCESLTEVSLQGSVTQLGDYAFAFCSKLTSITLSKHLRTIGESAFERCERLASIEIPDETEVIGERAFIFCEGLTSVTIPDSVSELKDGAFCGCVGLTSVIMPKRMKTIGSYVFKNCTALTSVTVPDGAENIGNRLYEGCTNLKYLKKRDGSVRVRGASDGVWLPEAASEPVSESKVVSEKPARRGLFGRLFGKK